MEVRMRASRLLSLTNNAIKDDKKIIVHAGGSRSSKTYTIMQILLLRAMADKKEVVTIVRSKLTWVKSTILLDFKRITEEYHIPVTPEINVNRAEQVYNVNGSEFAFFGLDYSEKLHGRQQDWFWINEAMEVNKFDFDQLEMRTNRGGFIDYNPTEGEHWVYDLSKRSDVGIIHSTMLDNPFLPEAITDKIRSYEPTPENLARGTADDYMWSVYGLGIKSKLRGAVFDNWDIVKLPSEARLLAYGLDYGYTNDPAACASIHLCDGELYFKELIYKRGMLNRDISNEFQALAFDKNIPIYADSAEPKSNDELCSYGWSVIPTVKGADSIKYGIDIMKTFKIHVVEGSDNLIEELRKYKYAQDKFGNSLNTPVDAFNHLIDSIRYATVMIRPELFVKQKQKDSWGYDIIDKDDVMYVSSVVDVM